SSEMPQDEPSIEDYAAVAVRFLDALGLDRVHLVGHSVGTVMAAALHKAHPGRLLSVTMAEAVVGSGRMPREAQDEAIAARKKDFETLGAAEVARARTPNSLSPNADPAVIQKAIEFAARVQVPGHLKLFVALIRAHIFDHVTPLACPAMIVAGSDDRSAPADLVKQIGDAYPGIRHHVIDGIGHQIAMEKPERFLGLISDFLASVEAGRQAAE
ncbi:MAG: alpha/beta hydrolase, partial [Acetobacterales bacterium]